MPTSTSTFDVSVLDASGRSHRHAVGIMALKQPFWQFKRLLQLQYNILNIRLNMNDSIRAGKTGGQLMTMKGKQPAISQDLVALQRQSLFNMRRSLT